MTAPGTGTGKKQRTCTSWRAILLLPFCWPIHAAPPTAAEARQQLRAAVESADRKDTAGAQAAVFAVIDSAVFDTLDEPTRHAAFSLAAQLAMQMKNFEQAHRMAVLATQSTEQGVDDWQRRLNSSIKLGDRRDEAVSLTTIARRWGRDPSMLPAATVRQVLRDTVKVDAAARLDLLQALYELRWRPGEGSAGTGWLELSRLLLDQKRTQDAIQVAALIRDPRGIIALRADRRFRPLRKSELVKSNPRRAAKEEIDALRLITQQRPRSLQALQQLIFALLNSRMDAEALALCEDAARRMDAAGGAATPPYDDVDNYNWILDVKARALLHLRRYDEAIEELRRGAEWPQRRDLVSQPIDLALLLCEFDRPDEALAALPAPESANGFGKMLMTLARLTAAVERGAAADADQALAYLREHRSDSPSVLQDGLLRAGALDDAERVLLSRLNDPEERTAALIQMQVYFEPQMPPRAAEWRDRYSALKERPAVRAAIAEFGEIDHYEWTYGYD